MTRYTILEDHEDYTPRSIEYTSLKQYTGILSWCYRNLRGDQYSVDEQKLSITFYTAQGFMLCVMSNVA